jgi:hypothetical protein
MRHEPIRRWSARALAVTSAGLLLAPAAAGAATRPTATTGPAANVGQQSATLTGSLNPNGAETIYAFEYGTTQQYGTATPLGNAGAGTRRVNVTADIGGLAPATRYHYRLVTRNAGGVSRGADRTFRTQRQPLGLTLTASPNPVPPSGATMISGTLSGTGNADRRVVLQANPFPYTSGFQQASDTHITGPQGQFNFPVLGLFVNTQFRVFLPGLPNVASPIVTVGVAPIVSASARKVRRLRRGAVVRFSGRIRPAHDGAQVVVQRLRRGGWVNVAGTVARHARGGYSSYGKSVRLRRGGTFRVYAGIADGDHAPAVSRAMRVRVR